MERTFESAAALVSRAAGPLASHLGAFVSSLIDQQYAANITPLFATNSHAIEGAKSIRPATAS